MTLSVPLPLDVGARPERVPVCCEDCHRPLTSLRSRRQRRGQHCKRKARDRTVRRGGRFTVDQEQLPGADPT